MACSRASARKSIFTRSGSPDSRPYRGRDGVRQWFARLKHRGHDQQIILSEARDVGAGRAFAGGSLSLSGECNIGPFWALHRIDGGLIVAAKPRRAERSKRSRQAAIERERARRATDIVTRARATLR